MTRWQIARIAILAGLSWLGNDSGAAGDQGLSGTGNGTNAGSMTAPAALPETVVTATRSREETRNIAQSVTVVTSEAIERRQALTPNQMLREEPGIWSVQVPVQGSPIIRGQIGNRVMYLWDGIPINNGALFGGPNGYFNQFPVGSVDRMEVIRGPGSVQYGSGAIGGVINILSKQATFFPNGFQTGGDVSARYGYGLDETTETADFWLGDSSLSLSGGISYQNVGNYRGPDVGILRYTGFNAVGGNLSFAWHPLTNHTLRVSWIFNQRDDVNSYIQSKLNPSGVPRLFNPYERRTLPKIDYEIDDLGFLSSQLEFHTYYQGYDQLRERRVESVSTSGVSTMNNTKTAATQEVVGGGVQNTMLLDSAQAQHKITYGTDYRAEDISSSQRLYRTVTPPGTTSATEPSGITPDGTYDVFDLFALVELHPLERWTLTTGGRYERTHLHALPIPTDVIPNAGYTIDDLKLDKVWNSGTWSVGTVYGVTSELDLAANIATGFRAPTFSDTLSTGTPVFSTRVASVPSPNVKPEQSITYEAGPRYHSAHWNVSLTAYWTELTDVIRQATNGTVVIPGQGTFARQQASNSGEGYVRGLEFAMAYRLGQGWSLFGNAAYTEGWDTHYREYYRFIPPLNGVVSLRYEAPSGRWWSELAEVLVDRFRHAAPTDKTDAGFSTDPGYGSSSATNPPLDPNYQIPGYAVTNLRGGVKVWQSSRGASRLDLTLDLNNLLNKKYREVYAQQELVAPGFNVVMGGRLQF